MGDQSRPDGIPALQVKDDVDRSGPEREGMLELLHRTDAVRAKELHRRPMI